jgi:proline iminopeptidase
VYCSKRLDKALAEAGFNRLRAIIHKNKNAVKESIPMDRRKFLKGAAVAAVAAPVSVSSLAAAPAPEPMEGDALNPPGIRLAGVKMVPVVGGKYKVWTKKIGSGPVKVLLLHGGPGASHEYLEAMESFLPEAGIEMYYYDQLGVNFSDQPDDSSLWTLERYTEEVEEVRRGLGLDQFVLYGHSWGGILAMEYALKYQQHLRALVISDMTAGTKAYLKRTAALKEQMLSPEDLAKLNALEAAGSYDSPEYTSLMTDKLYPQMLCRTKPWPNAVDRAFQHLNEKIYVQMQGKSEFVVTGNLKDWERWDRLHEIKVKTLTIGARYDEMDPEDMKKMAQLVQHGTYAYCPNGSHMGFWDDQQVYFQHLLGFLRSV